MDYLDTLLGVLISLGAYRLGRRSKRPYREPEPQAVRCRGCGHPRSYHAPAETGQELGACAYNVHPYAFDGKKQACACQQYDGPQPLIEYYHPEA